MALKKSLIMVAISSFLILLLIPQNAIPGPNDKWLECSTTNLGSSKTVGETTYYCCLGPEWKTEEYSCKLQNLKVNNQNCPITVNPGATLTFTFEYYGTGPSYKYEYRSLWRDGTRIDCHSGDAATCIWHSDSFITAAPSTPGTYTYTVGCYGATKESSFYCDSSDNSQSCTVTVSGVTTTTTTTITPICCWYNRNCYSPGATHPANECKYCSSGGSWENKKCGTACSSNNGVCDGAGSCYEGASTSSCTLNCKTPSPPSGYTRVLTGSCNRPANCKSPNCQGVYKSGDNKVCHLNSCEKSDSSITITGSWSGVEYPSGNYYTGDEIKIKVKGVTSTSGWTPLIECRLIKRDKNGNVVGGIEFNHWGTGDKTFNYTITQNDPSGTWSIEYCGVWSDFVSNKGWNFVFDGTARYFNVSTALVVGWL